MKIDLNTIEKATSPISLFYAGIKAEATRKQYVKTLKVVVNEFLEDILTEKGFEARVNELVNRAKKNNDWIRDVLITMVSELRKRTELPSDDTNYLNPNSIGNYIPPLKKLLDMNDIPIIWKKIHSLLPESIKSEKGRGYLLSEIKTLLKHSNAIDKSIILIACSSGIRIGAFDFKWKHIRPVYQYNNELLWEDDKVTESVSKEGKIVCAMILIYEESKSQMFAFITPEAYQATQDYKKICIQEKNMRIKPEDSFLKHQGVVERPLTTRATGMRIMRLAKKVGLRPPLEKGKRRYDVPLMNGFRRFFNKKNKETISKDSLLASLIKKEQMMGHVGLIQLDKNYFQSHVSELIEEYLLAVPNLTISDDDRHKQIIQDKDRKITDLQRKEQRIVELEYMMKKQNEEIDDRIKTKTREEMVNLRDEIKNNYEKQMSESNKRMERQDSEFIKKMSENDADKEFLKSEKFQKLKKLLYKD